MNTLARYMEEIGKNVKVGNLPAAELLVCKKNGKEYKPDSISVFSEVSKDI